MFVQPAAVQSRSQATAEGSFASGEVQGGIKKTVTFQQRLPSGRFFGFPTVLVAVSGRYVYLSLSPHDAQAFLIRRLDESYDELSSEYSRLLPPRARVTHIIPWDEDRAAVRLGDGSIGVVSPTTTTPAWRRSIVRSIDARWPGNRAVSVTQIREPDLFAYWWYEVLLPDGSVVPGPERSVVFPEDMGLLVVRPLGETLCGVQGLRDGSDSRVNRLAARCWTPSGESSLDVSLEWPWDDIAQLDVTDVAIAYRCVWVLVRTMVELPSGGNATGGDADFALIAYEMGSAEPIAWTTITGEPILLSDGGYLLSKRRRSGEWWLTLETLAREPQCRDER